MDLNLETFHDVGDDGDTRQRYLTHDGAPSRD